MSRPATRRGGGTGPAGISTRAATSRCTTSASATVPGLRQCSTPVILPERDRAPGSGGPAATHRDGPALLVPPPPRHLVAAAVELPLLGELPVGVPLAAGADGEPVEHGALQAGRAVGPPEPLDPVDPPVAHGDERDE